MFRWFPRFDEPGQKGPTMRSPGVLPSQHNAVLGVQYRSDDRRGGTREDLVTMGTDPSRTAVRDACRFPTPGASRLALVPCESCNRCHHHFTISRVKVHGAQAASFCTRLTVPPGKPRHSTDDAQEQVALVVPIPLSWNRCHASVGHHDLVMRIDQQQSGHRILPPSSIRLVVVPVCMAPIQYGSSHDARLADPSHVVTVIPVIANEPRAETCWTTYRIRPPHPPKSQPPDQHPTMVLR